MIGWANYFCLGPVSKAYRAVESHACKRLRQWLCAKHKVSRDQAVSEASLYDVLGSSALPSGRALSRGRHRDPFSESRKRKSAHPVRLSGV